MPTTPGNDNRLSADHRDPSTRLTPAGLDLLALAAARGDDESFRSLVLHTQQAVRLHLAARAPGDLVEELVQSTYVEAWSALAGYEPQGLLIAWLKGIARNLLQRELRERARIRHVRAGDIAELLADHAAQPGEVEMDEEALVSRLRTCLDSLQPAARDLLRRRYVDGQGLEQLESVLQRTREALAAQLYRLRNVLRNCVERPEAL